MQSPIVSVLPAVKVVQPEDTVVINLPRRTAEVLRTILNFIGGPSGVGEPRTRLDQLHFALMRAGVQSANKDVCVTGSTSYNGRYPVGLRLGWAGGKALAPAPDVTGGLVVGLPSGSRETDLIARSLSKANALPDMQACECIHLGPQTGKFYSDVVVPPPAAVKDVDSDTTTADTGANQVNLNVVRNALRDAAQDRLAHPTEGPKFDTDVARDRFYTNVLTILKTIGQLNNLCPRT